MLRRRQRPQITVEERRLLSLLLDGDTPFLSALRKQVEHPGYHRWVERSHEPGWFRLTFVTDGRFNPTVRATSVREVDIDDLCAQVEGVTPWLQVVGMVSEGILGNVELRSDKPVRWPRRLEVIAWRYGVGGVGRDLSRWDLPVPSPASKDDAPRWLRPFLDSPGVTATGGGAAAEDVEGLPKRLAEFLRWSDGVTLFGAEVLGTTGLYEVEHEGRRLLVFSPAEDGSLSALDLDAGNATDAPVFFVDVHERRTFRIAPSFVEWVMYLSEEANRLNG